jgi:hypothetical protein
VIVAITGLGHSRLEQAHNEGTVRDLGVKFTMTNRFSVRISADEYDAIRALISDADMPMTHAGWLKRMEEVDARCFARADVIHPVEVYAQEFSDWCARSGLDTSLYALGAFAVVKGGRK